MSDLKISESYFESPVDRVRLYRVSWQTRNKPRRVIVFHHGIGEHCHRYRNLIEGLSELGTDDTAYYSFDARGHGRSGGVRGHSEAFGDFGLDLDFIVRDVRKHHPDSELVLFGHSMGAAIVLDYLETVSDVPVDRVMISAPPIRIVETPILSAKRHLGTALGRFVPRLVITSSVDPEILSSDQDAVDAYRRDPLVHAKVSLRLGVDLFGIGESILERAPGLQMPILIFHGTDDRLAAPSGSEALFRRIGSADKTLRLFQDLRHETLNEPPQKRAEVVKTIKDWLG